MKFQASIANCLCLDPSQDSGQKVNLIFCCSNEKNTKIINNVQETTAKGSDILIKKLIIRTIYGISNVPRQLPVCRSFVGHRSKSEPHSFSDCATLSTFNRFKTQVYRFLAFYRSGWKQKTVVRSSILASVDNTREIPILRMAQFLKYTILLTIDPYPLNIVSCENYSSSLHELAIDLQRRWYNDFAFRFHES